VSVSGPYGDFFVKYTDREKCFMGGGAGIAPLRSHVLNLLEGDKTTQKVSLWYGARTRKDICYHDTFTRLDGLHDNFSYHVCLSRPDPEQECWDGLYGYIQTNLAHEYLAVHDDPSEIEL